MRISLLSLVNWGPFRGVHQIHLEPKPYAVIARRKENPESSNGAGKTTLVEAIEFALYGKHRWRLEDDLITKGESEASVSLHFDDGIMVSRSRKRGQATQLLLVVPDGTSAKQDEAQSHILKLVGLDADDYRNTAYLVQKQAHRLVTSRPEERMSIVGGWLRLDRIEACADTIRSKTSNLLQRKTQLEARHEMAVSISKSSLGEAKDESELTSLLQDVDREREAVRSELQQKSEELKQVEQEKLIHERAHELSLVKAEGKKLKAERDALDPKALEQALDRASTDLRMAVAADAEATRELTQKTKLAKGKFDGRCPVADISCPVKDQINERGQENEKLRAKALSLAEQAERRKEAALQAERRASTHFQAVQWMDVRLETLREQARRLKTLGADEKVDYSPTKADDLRSRISALQDRLSGLSMKSGQLSRALDEYLKAQETIREVGYKLRELGAELDTHRAAAVIFGRNGAQRRIAEGALSQIEAGANTLLSECGSDLRVAINWAREGQGLAKHCESCGSSFPTSTKVKVCERCGAPRGPHLVQKLEVELSDRSGALDDLGSMCLQLSAWRWLRAARGIAWNVLVLDEPASAFDRSLRRSFTAYLHRVLLTAAIEQVFVISHDASMLESLPGRIQITNDGGNASVEVV